MSLVIRSNMLRSYVLRLAISAFVIFSMTAATPVSYLDALLNPIDERSNTDFEEGYIATDVEERAVSTDLEERYIINCTDPGAAFDVSCWGQLDLSDWLNNPTTGWNKTTQVCNETQDSAKCCIPGEAWTTCFLRLGHGFGGVDCTEINAQTCSLDMSQKTPPETTAQVHYVMKNIYGIFHHFTG